MPDSSNQGSSTDNTSSDNRGKNQGKSSNPGNFANRSKSEVSEAGRKGGQS